MGGLGKGPNGEDDGGGRRDDAAPREKEKGPSGPVETKEGPEGPSLRPAPLGGGRALRERGVPSSRGLAPQYFGRWRA